MYTRMKEEMKKGKAVIVGGSIAGISCAHALNGAGWDVVVLEKTSSPPDGCTTGAGLGLDSVSHKLIEPWLKQPHLLQLCTLPLTEHCRETKVSISEQLTGLISITFYTTLYHQRLFCGAICSSAFKTELVKVMRETNEPFLNAIYDSEPLQQLCWENVVLIGDAAHPISPHGARSTNMSILDAAVLGKCLQKWGMENLNAALKEYESIRVPVVSEQVLFSRRIGRIKQRLPVSDCKLFDPMEANQEESKMLHLSNIPYFNDIPSILE